MREHDQRAAGSLVAAARLHADEAILHQVDAPDPVLGADRVQRLEQLERLHLLAVDRDRHALLETDGHFAGLVGRFRGTLGQHPDVVRRGVGRIFERPAFVRDVPDIAVAAVDLGGRCRDRHVVLAGVLDGVLARNDVPFAPWRDHRQLRRQRLVGQLEADLIVALAGAAVRQGVAAGGERDFHLLLGQQRPGDRGAEQILVLVDAAGAHQLPEILARRTPRACPRCRLRTRRSCAPFPRGRSARRRPGRYRRTRRPLRSRSFPSTTE